MVSLTIGKNCKIDPSATINVKNGHIGDGTIIGKNAIIEGNNVVLGRESFIGNYAWIGGGSCFDKTSNLITGDWFHLGQGAHLNTARSVIIGHEVALSVGSKLFTHASFLDAYSLGFNPQWGDVTIGDNVMIFSSHINPGVTIGNNVIIGAMSLVNKDLPDGCFAAGTPVKIINSKFLPNKRFISEKKDLVDTIIKQIYNRPELENFEGHIGFNAETESLYINTNLGNTNFYLNDKKIHGAYTAISIAVKDQLRRNGIRFRYEPGNNEWVPWS